MNSPLTTVFASAERSTTEEVQRQFELIQELPQVVHFLDALPTLAIVLNQHRQIVFANRAFLKMVKTHDVKAVTGQRPGEAVDCIHATENRAGCGTTMFCKTCGAIRAILKSQNGVEDVQEFRLQRQVGQQTEAVDLRIWTNPLQVNDKTFTMVTMADVSNQKRRQMLERIFFHDILNTAGGVYGLAHLLKHSKDESEVHELSGLLWTTSEQLIGEINAQRMLTDAENNELEVKPILTDLKVLLCDIAAAFSSHLVAKERLLLVRPDIQAIQIQTDPVLLRRVVINLVKNALEASVPGETVTLNVEGGQGVAEITVHNQAVMPEETRLQIFYRSFSTRGTGRGIGTYSAKLLTERYLGGKISFDSTEPNGTTFRITLPLEFNKDTPRSGLSDKGSR